jgi:hypothetical protein
MKVTKRTHTLLFVACMVFVMAFFMSAFLTAVNAGFKPNFLFLWMRSFAMSYVVAFPIAATAAPMILNLLRRYIEIENHHEKPEVEKVVKG